MKLFDATLGQLERSLDVRLARHNLLSGNLANVDTPGYKPKDVDFQAAMAQSTAAAGASPVPGLSGASAAVAVTRPGHLGAASGAGFGAAGGSAVAGDMPVIDGTAAAPGLDGNRVDLDRTMAQLAENGMQYGASARAASKKLAILRYVASDGQG